ncbi:inosine-5-monophosphate dehydrogenase [Pandoraea terrae]|uniref:Inosine-5-monophosphate dehydrogenase n=1 Tax=Pandoraea terrae TaxID=1537710 RepID=A0A5E4XME5_9BURK|nr:CBS domain-containing protein [Pandoraea terrae]VVE37464.1 inosine-5-monophosphate dehydrogenase [Pandoraea terrae]
MKTVAQLLKTKTSATVYQVPPSAFVRDALVMMAEGRVGAVLVTEGDKIVGIFTERDYARKVALHGRTSENTTVRDVMTTSVMYVRPDQTNEECMAIMTQNRLRHLPVVDDGQLIGIISIGDLVKDIISEQQFTIDQLENYIMGGGGAMTTKQSRPS